MTSLAGLVCALVFAWLIIFLTSKKDAKPPSQTPPSEKGVNYDGERAEK